MMPAGGVSHRKTPADKVFFLLKQNKKMIYLTAWKDGHTTIKNFEDDQ